MKVKSRDIPKKREILIKFLRKNPKTTYKEIRKKTGIHPERIFPSLKEAFIEAGISPPRNFERKTKRGRRRIIINYIKKHPKVGGHTISKETKINVASAFKNIEYAYRAAGVDYPRKIDPRKKEEKKKQIVNLVRENPLITIQEIIRKTNSQPYHFFKNIGEIYKKAGIKMVNGGDKRNLKKQREVIKFVKENTLTTQREINKGCKTKVQNLFKKGIFEAYEKAEVKFPFERLKLYGVGLKSIRERAKNFEDKIALKLSGYGKVNKLVKTKRGVADIILERKEEKIVFEVKDYKNKEISISQIKQLNKYLEDLNSRLGILICHKKPKKDKFLIGKNKIFVLEKEELQKLSEIIDAGQ